MSNETWIKKDPIEWEVERLMCKCGGGVGTQAEYQVRGQAISSLLQQVRSKRSKGTCLSSHRVESSCVTPEAKVKKKVREALKELGAYYAMPVTGGYGVSGTPDFLVCWRGQFFGIECKANGNKPTALQERAMRAIREAGGACMVIDETNVDQLGSIMRAYEIINH